MHKFILFIFTNIYTFIIYLFPIFIHFICWQLNRYWTRPKAAKVDHKLHCSPHSLLCIYTSIVPLYGLYIAQSNSNRAISYFLPLSRSFSSTIRLNSNSVAALLLLCFAFFMLEQIFCSCFKFPYALQLFSNECRMLLSCLPLSPSPASLPHFTRFI